jgi:ASC-1-like (ASCH) protein
MKSYMEYINESQYVDLYYNGYGFRTKKYSISAIPSIQNLNQMIKKYTDSVYTPFGYQYGKNVDIKINDNLIINGEYISKMVNNYTVFKRFILENKIRNEDEFYSLLLSNLYDVYHYNGEFFKNHTLSILINTTKKGNIAEKRSLDSFKDVVSERGINIEIQSPSMEEDIKGIDAKFTLNGKNYTIQVKPFTSVHNKDGKRYAKSPGSLSLGVNYLILYKEHEYIILKNPPSNPITIRGEFFVYDSGNIVSENLLLSSEDIHDNG